MPHSLIFLLIVAGVYAVALAVLALTGDRAKRLADPTPLPSDVPLAEVER